MQHVGIPEPQNAISVRSQDRITASIVIRVSDMLAAIELDDHLSLDADEVADVRTDRSLTSELVITELATSKLAPEQPLGIGRTLAQEACEVVHESDLSRPQWR